MITITSPVTGSAVTGLTTPTFTLVSDISPSIYGKQWAVTVLGGTQTGVTAHSADRPFTIAYFRAPVIKQLPPKNPVTGLYKPGKLSRMVDKYIVREATLCAPDLWDNLLITLSVDRPAGSASYDPNRLSAALSLLAGVVAQQSVGISDTLRSGLV